MGNERNSSDAMRCFEKKSVRLPKEEWSKSSNESPWWVESPSSLLDVNVFVRVLSVRCLSCYTNRSTLLLGSNWPCCCCTQRCRYQRNRNSPVSTILIFRGNFKEWIFIGWKIEIKFKNSVEYLCAHLKGEKTPWGAYLGVSRFSTFAQSEVFDPAIVFIFWVMQYRFGNNNFTAKFVSRE